MVMADKGTRPYYKEMLDLWFRVVVASFVLLLSIFWLYWVFNAKSYGYCWYILLAWAFIIPFFYFIAYYSQLPIKLSRRYQDKNK